MCASGLSLKSLVIFLPPLFSRVLDYSARRMVFRAKSASKSCTNGAFLWAYDGAGTVVAINAKFQASAK